MAYTPSLKLILPAAGDFSGTWGTLAINDQITSLVDVAVAGYLSVAFASPTADQVLSSGNGSAANESRTMYLNMTGGIGSALNVIAPTLSKLYYIKNSTSGGFAITLKTAAGTGISIPNGKAMVLVCDGTNVVDAVTAFSSLNVNTTLSIAGDLSIASYTETIVASGTVGAAATLAITLGTVLTATLTAAPPCTFTMPTATAGKSFVLQVIQSATSMTTATFTGVKWPGGTAPTITATASAVDIISFVSIGGFWYGNAAQAFA